MTERPLNRYWRIFATGFSFAVFGVGGVILGYVILPIVALFSHPLEIRRRRCRYLIHLSFKAFAWLMQCLGPLKWTVKGREILEQDGRLVVANHPSLIDIVFLISLIPNATCIVKSAVYRNPFMRGPVSWAGYIPNHSPQQLVEDCVDELAKGSSLVVFPEGTRTTPDRPLMLKRGAAHIWLKANCEVTLVTITAQPPMLRKHDKWYDVPPCPALFILDVSQAKLTDNTLMYGSENIAARAVTKRWTEHFTVEIKA